MLYGYILFPLLFLSFLAARTFLAIQNVCGALCAIGVSTFLWIYDSELDASSKAENVDTKLGNDSLHYETPIASNNESLNETTSPFVPSLQTAKLATIIGVIIFSSVVRLASSGTIIILQKDLTVVISGNDTDYLASMYISKTVK